MMVVILTLLTPISTYAQRNRNLRENNGQTLITLSGVYNFGTESMSHQGVSSYIGISRHRNWWHYGLYAGGDFMNETLSAKAFIGPKLGRNFYFAPAISFGLGQSRTESVYTNPNNDDLFKQNLPAPKFLVGAQARLGYNFKNFGIFAGVSYDYFLGYSQSQSLSEPWIEVSKNSQKDRLSVELGLAYVIGGETMISGDNCITSSVGGGYSSMGWFTSVDVMGYSRLSYALGHSYGGTFAFYTESGNAEIGGKYMLNWIPGGSNGIYNAGIGVSAVVGQYSRTWEGVANDDPERLQVGGKKMSFGGGASIDVVPVALQFGVVNISLFGSYGFRAIAAVKGEGDLNYNANSTSATVLSHWTAGARIELAF